MSQPPNNQPWQQPQQPNTFYPSQQPQYPPPPNGYYPPQQQWQQPPRQEQLPFQQQPWQPPQIPPPSKKRRNPWLIIGIIAGVLVLLASAIGYAVSTSSPTLTPEQFRASAQETTVENLDKDGNADKGKNVYFTSTISSFVKDDSGNTAGANVRGTDTTTFAVVQISFPEGTDITKLNQGDTLEIWGTDQGVFSGKNGFGATIQEVEVAALYMADVTSSYNIP